MSVSMSEKYAVIADAHGLPTRRRRKATAELLDRSLAHRVRNGTRPVEVGEHRTSPATIWPRLLITDSSVAATVLTTSSHVDRT